MAKELVVSSAGHETKVAILEDNQVVEAYFERKREYSLAGSIYKGRVTRVLPGMQSAFVEVGLERDAFLYVSDFLEDLEEYDKIVTSVEDKVSKMEETRSTAVRPAEPPPPPPQEIKPEASEAAEAPAQEAAPEKSSQERDPRDHRDRGGYSSGRRGRHRRGRRRGFPDSKYSRQKDSAPPVKAEQEQIEEVDSEPTILPGESLAKYRGAQNRSEQEPSSETMNDAEVGKLEVSPEESFSDEAAQAQPELAEEQGEPEITVPIVQEQAAGVEIPIVPPAVEESAVELKPIVVQETAPEPEAASEASAEEEQEEVRQEFEAAVSAPEEGAGAATEQASDPFEARQETPAVWEADPDNPEKLAGEAVEESVEEAASDEEQAEGFASDEASLETEPESGSEEETADRAADPNSDGAPRRRQAGVREGRRNPRYQRRSRWGSRRQGQGQAAQQESRSGGGRPRERSTPTPQIADLLKEGQEIIVQIAKEPLGKKGARITSHVALPGRYLVYMPTVSHVGVSHKIASDEERQRLKRIIQAHSRNIPGGFIVRTAGEGQSEEELRQDIQFLANMWSDIKSQAEKAKAPALLHHDLDLVQRIIRDQLSEEFSAVWVDNELEYERMVNWVGRFQPSLVGRVKLYTKDVPLFEQMGIQDEINKALKPKVWLKSGGYIVINQTEALVAIDVNTGKFVGRSSRLEDTIVKTNIDAIQEIVRQIRLRDLGGIIVVDFIDMDERKNRHKVMSALEEALRSDRSPSKILAFNEFGLVAITRKRVRQSLERTLGEPCPHCAGSGYVKSAFTVCSEIYTEARKMAQDLEGRQVTLRVNPEVGKTLKARDNTILSEMEEMLGTAVVIRNDPNMHVESFAFE